MEIMRGMCTLGVSIHKLWPIAKMTGFHKTYIDILETIDDCIKKNRINPSLILLYSAIDSFSYLANRTSKNSKKVFLDWVKEWMVDKYGLPCNEIDIYAARCGVLHTQTSESDLSNKNEARELYYVHGEKPIEPLENAIRNSNDKREKVIPIRIEDLVSSFRLGMADCTHEISKDKDWEKIFNDKKGKYFVLV